MIRVVGESSVYINNNNKFKDSKGYCRIGKLTGCTNSTAAAAASRGGTWASPVELPAPCHIPVYILAVPRLLHPDPALWSRLKCCSSLSPSILSGLVVKLGSPTSEGSGMQEECNSWWSQRNCSGWCCSSCRWCDPVAEYSSAVRKVVCCRTPCLVLCSCSASLLPLSFFGGFYLS